MTLILQPGEGQYVSVGGGTVRTKAASSDSGGSLWIAEFTVPAGFGGPPAHIHTGMLEVFYVLEGNVSIRVGDATHALGPGGFALVSPGTLHTYLNPGEQPGKFLVVCSPGGLEKYFAELPELVATHGMPLPKDIDAALRARYDMVLPDR